MYKRAPLQCLLLQPDKLNLQPVNQDVQPQPNHIDKMPVPGCALKAKMFIWAEVAFLQSQRDEQQHQHADKNMEAVETGEHEKS